MRSGIDSKVLGDVLDERARQDGQWGGPTHDDQHGGIDWCNFITNQVGAALLRPADFRERMVKVAALAVAAIESHDRCSENYARWAEQHAKAQKEITATRETRLRNMDRLELRYGEQPPDPR